MNKSSSHNHLLNRSRQKDASLHTSTISQKPCCVKNSVHLARINMHDILCSQQLLYYIHNYSRSLTMTQLDAGNCRWQFLIILIATLRINQQTAWVAAAMHTPVLADSNLSARSTARKLLYRSTAPNICKMNWLLLYINITLCTCVWGKNYDSYRCCCC